MKEKVSKSRSPAASNLSAKERLIKASRMSIPQIATRTGLTLGQLYRMLDEDPQRRRVPMVSSFHLIALATGLTMDELFSVLYPRGVRDEGPSTPYRARQRKSA
jgi:DNA-binding phage protein